MEPRTPGQIEATGTLPVAGTGMLPVAPVPSAEPPREERPGWVEEARASIEAPGKYLAYEESGTRIVVPVAREWTRIGRSLAADVRFDDATVSRRHALVVSQADGVRVLDDRSLNGVYVNGRRVEWSPLGDGDEIVVGRHRIFFLDTAAVAAEPPPAPALAE
jgi:pSer/pThr/pTyr-binding forkhead associated (FHA) protein